jgi:hypothetical protein
MLRDPKDPLSGWTPLHDPGPVPDLSHLDLHRPLEGEWLLADHPWAEAERTRRRALDLSVLVASSAPGPAKLAAEVDAAAPDSVYVRHMRRSLEALRQIDDPMYVYPPALLGPMGSLWPPPGTPAYRPGCEAGGWNSDL